MADTAMRNHPYLLSLLVQAAKHVGRIKIGDKGSSRFWKCMPRRWQECITVLGRTIWFPGGYNLNPGESHLLAVTHEVVHLMQKKELGRVGFYVRYLSPQIFVLLAAAFFAVPLLGIAGVLLPWPSPWRGRLEEQAYATESWLARELGWDQAYGKSVSGRRCHRMFIGEWLVTAGLGNLATKQSSIFG